MASFIMVPGREMVMVLSTRCACCCKDLAVTCRFINGVGDVCKQKLGVCADLTTCAHEVSGVQ